MYQWAEEDFTLPYGVIRLESAQPVSGKTYVMYHGTSRDNIQSIRKYGFSRSKDGMLGPGVYLSRDLEKASRYPLKLDESQRIVIKVQVNVGKVIVINRQGHPNQKNWHCCGYDSAWVPANCGMVPSGLEENCLWDPKRISILGFISPRPTTSLGWGAQGYMCAGNLLVTISHASYAVNHYVPTIS